MKLLRNRNNTRLLITLENEHEIRAFSSMMTGKPMGSMGFEQLKLDLANQFIKEVSRK